LEKANIICNRQLLPGDIKAGRNYEASRRDKVRYSRGYKARYEGA